MKLTSVFVACLIGLCRGQVDDSDPALEVTINSGPIRGLNFDENHRAWLGIPYAKPPTGSLRFAPPEPATSWTDRLETRTQPNACQQSPDLTFGEDFEGATMWNPNTPISEDCLYLNVHAPRNNDNEGKPLPVLVWIYGGGYMTGSAALDVYNPKQLIEQGVIFVAMQYRVGSHGFLYLGGDSGAPGNVGMLDQVLALQWVKDNIAVFGGDPNKVTLMGESAGAHSVALHYISPMSKSLFQQGILQSTGLDARWAYMSPEEGRNRSLSLAELVGCPIEGQTDAQIVECLRSKPSEDLLAQEYSVATYTLNFFPFVTTLDGNFIQKSPKELLADDSNFPESMKKPTLLGSNANEGFWSLMYLHPLFPNRELTEEETSLTFPEFRKAVNEIFPFYSKRTRTALTLIYAGRRNWLNVKSEKEVKLFFAIDQMAGDSDFVCSTEEFAQRLSNRGYDVFRYHYAERSSTDQWPSYTGIKHGDELEFTFGHPLNTPNNYEADEVKLSESLVNYWTSFVKNGSPNFCGMPATWPMYKEPRWQYLNFSAAETFVDGRTFEENCQFWIKNDLE